MRIQNTVMVALLGAITFLPVSGLAVGKTLEVEGISEDCALTFPEQKMEARKQMEYQAQTECGVGGSVRQISKIQFDRYLIPCTDDERVFGVAATADFECYVPF